MIARTAAALQRQNTAGGFISLHAFYHFPFNTWVGVLNKSGCHGNCGGLTHTSERLKMRAFGLRSLLPLGGAIVWWMIAHTAFACQMRNYRIKTSINEKSFLTTRNAELFVTFIWTYCWSIFHCNFFFFLNQESIYLIILNIQRCDGNQVMFG